MGVDWGRDDNEYEYDEYDRPQDRRKKRRGADWDDRDWAPSDEPMGPDADWDRDFQPQRSPEEEERYRREYEDRARSHHYYHGGMTEVEREKVQFEEARWEASREPRRAPPPQSRGYKGSGGKWEDDVYQSHRPPDRNMAADEFYRMQQREWEDKQYEDPYRPKKKPKASAPKWYKTDAEKSRMAKRQAHTPYVEKEKIILEAYNLPVGMVILTVLMMIGGAIGLMFTFLAIFASSSLSGFGVDPASVAGIAIFIGLVVGGPSLLAIYAGIAIFERKHWGWAYMRFAIWLVFIPAIYLMFFTAAFLSICLFTCIAPIVGIGGAILVYTSRHESIFKG